MSKNRSYENILSVAREASRQGADVLKSYFGNITNVQEKPDASIVSEADRESERIISEHLTKAFPEFSIHGEEGGLVASAAPSEGTWFIDPLDGTTNFVHGFPYFSTSIGLEIDGEIVVAAVDAPILGLTVWATRGGGAFLNGKRLKVHESKELSECLLATGFSYGKEHGFSQQLKVFSHFLSKTRGVRRPGAAVLDMCYTASGVFDVFWERNLKSWDMAAGSLIIEEAGGIVTEMDGNRWSVNSSSILAGSPHIHSIMIKEILSLR